MGLRGDVQPFVALGVGLRQAGHEVRLATDPAFEDLARTHGLEFFPLKTNSRADMQNERVLAMTSGISRNPLSTPFYARSSARGRDITPFFDNCWQASQGADAIVSHALIYPAEHIAERLDVPQFTTWVSPWNAPAFLRAYFPRWLPLSDRVCRVLWV
jgi:UDP:flavonoid glycosyltransferase YjiC (YdhE family)